MTTYENKDLDITIIRFDETKYVADVRKRFGESMVVVTHIQSNEERLKISQHSHIVMNGETYVSILKNSHVEALNMSCEVREKASVIATGTVLNRIEFYDNTDGTVRGEIRVFAMKDAALTIKEKVTVKASGYARVYAYDNCEVYAADHSRIIVSGNAKCVAGGSCMVTAKENAVVEANDTCLVETHNNAKVTARNHVIVDSYGNMKSKVTAIGQVVVNSKGTAKIIAGGDTAVRLYGGGTAVVSEFAMVSVMCGKRGVVAKVRKEKNFFGSVVQQVFTLEKDILVYKKLNNEAIATLKLVKGQTFQSQKHDKCRTDRAIVMAIEGPRGPIEVEHSQHDYNFIYTVGQTVSSPYDEKLEECSTGIHFFLTKEKAENY